MLLVIVHLHYYIAQDFKISLFLVLLDTDLLLNHIFDQQGLWIYNWLKKFRDGSFSEKEIVIFYYRVLICIHEITKIFC